MNYLQITLKAICICLFSVVLAFGLDMDNQLAFASDQSSVHQNVMNFASDKNFDAALALLAHQDITAQNSYEHRILKGRILSWAGQYNAAQDVISDLRREFPQNADVLLAAANLDYYQGDLNNAEHNFQSVLAINPNYVDAQTGLENVRKARSASRPHKWRIDGGASISSFDESDLDNWNNQFIRAQYTPGTIAYHGKVQHYRQFGNKNVEFDAGMSSAPGGDWDWGINAGFSPDADFRPDTHIGGRLGRKIKLDNGPTIVATVNYRYDKYTEAKIHNITPEVTAYFENGVRLTGRVINTIQSDQADQTGWLVSGSLPVAKKWKLNGGYASAPETVNGLVVTTESVFGGVSYAATSQLDLHVNFARDDRQDVYIRNAVNVGFTQKY